MSKELLINKFKDLDTTTYSWNLYFFKIDKRSTNPFKVHKVKFKNSSHLTQYAHNSIDTIVKFQILPISEVEVYNGENTKVSCDKLDLSSELISQQWQLLKQAVVQSSNYKIEDRIHGYILEGNSIHNNSADSIIFVKLANPISTVNTKKAVFFTSVNDKLDIISDETYRLYLTTDFIVYENNMYTFSHSFEKMFNLENTMKKVKTEVIDSLSGINCFSNDDNFKTHAKSYNNSRHFIEFSQERVDKLKTLDGRKYISNALHINLTDEGIFDDLSKEEVGKLIQYLCFKLIKDDDSKSLIKVSNATKMDS